jgi:DNA polymerase I-like protein with 3'-5' exonuclease and polymerase domains
LNDQAHQLVHISDNATDTSLFCLPVQANGADGFKLALCLISRALEGIDARIVHTQHDEIIVEARDGIEDQVETIVKESMGEAFSQIIPEVPFVAEIRVAGAWG